MKFSKILSSRLLAGNAVSIAGTVLLAGPSLAREHDALRHHRHENPSFTRAPLRHLEAKAAFAEPSIGITPVAVDSQFRHAQHFGHVRSDGKSQFTDSNDKTRALARGLELDLTSSDRSIVLGQNLFQHKSSFTINSGGEEKVLTAGDHVSPAEFVALQQVLEGGKQDLALDSDGRGVDGKILLDSITDGGKTIHARSLTIPASVDAIGNLSRSGEFRLTGDLINSGNLFLTDKKGPSTIAARDVINGSNASISSIGDLILNADRDLTNSGVIRGEGKITLSAGHTLTNAGQVNGQTELNLVSSAIRNSGSLTTNGNLNIDTTEPSSIAVNNTGGVMAAAGDLNIRSSTFTSKADTTLTGGDWRSKRFNVYSGAGHVNVDVDDITGGVTINSGTAILNSNGQELYIEQLVTSGDPLILSTGTIILDSQATNGGPLSVISTADINLFIHATISTRSTNADGGALLMIAGASYTVNANDVQINGPSATGGNINTNTQVVISSSSTVGNGGDIVLAAFSASPTTGQINLTSSQISTTGASGFNNGRVTAFAGGSINLGQINAGGFGTTNSGDISLNGSQPQVVGTLLLDRSSGAVLSGSLAPGSNQVKVSAGTITSRSSIAINGALVDVFGTATAPTISITSVDNDINLSQTVTPSLIINMQGSNAGIVRLGQPNNMIDSLSATGNGRIFLNNGSTDLALNSLGATQSLTATNIGTITIGNDIDTTGDISFTTDTLINSKSITANSIRIFSPSNALTIDGGTGGQLKSTGAAEKVIIGSWLGNITFQGALTFASNADVTVSDPAALLTIAPVANVTGQQSLTLNAHNIVLNGTIAANPLVINNDAQFGTIANSLGDVNISGPVTINGGNLAIIANGSVTASGPLTINTSSASGNGGALTILAGLTVVPLTPGQIEDSITRFDLSNSGNGSVSLAGVDVNTSSSNGVGGDVLIAANGGTVTIGNINSSGTTKAGDVQIFGQAGVTASDITATGTTGGAIYIRAGGPGIGFPGVQVFNGTITGEILPTLGSGPIVVGAMSTGSGSININAPDITIRGAIQSNVLNLAGIFLDVSSVTGGITLTPDAAGNGGMMRVEFQNVVYNSSPIEPFTLRADGTGSGNGGIIYFSDYKDPAPTYVGTVPKAKDGGQFLSFSAQSGTGSGGNGGEIHASFGGDATVDTSALLAGPRGTGTGTGGTYALESGDASDEKGGSLVLIGDLHADGINGGAGGSITLSANSKSNFALNSNKVPKNGVSGALTAIGPGGAIVVENVLGDLVVHSSEAVQASSIRLFSGEFDRTKSSIYEKNGAVVSADNLYLAIDGEGSIGKKTFTVNVQALSISCRGSARVENVGSALLDFGGGGTSKDFELISHSPLLVRSFAARDGDIKITGTSGGITLIGDPDPLGASSLTAINGKITINNTDTTNGFIELGLNTRVETQGDGGDVVLAIGDIPKKVSNTTPPPNIGIQASGGKGQVYFEPGQGAVQALGAQSFAIAENRSVIFSSTSALPIVLDGGVTVKADPPAHVASSPQLGNLASKTLVTISTDSYSTADTLQNSQEKSGAFVPTELLLRPGLTNAKEQTENEQQFTTNGITDAYFWCDEELGLSDVTILGKARDTDSNQLIMPTPSKMETAQIIRGAVVIAPSYDTKILTPFGIVKVSKGAIALMIVDDLRLALYDLHDTHKRSVGVSTGSKSIFLCPGACTVLTTEAHQDFERLNPIKSIGYRALRDTHFENGIKAFHAEFSTISAIGSTRCLRKLFASKHAAAKRLSTDLMKTSGVLLHIKDEEFRLYIEPCVTALN